MGYARVLTTAYKANLGGGAFADSLAANSGDSLTASQFTNEGARIINMWGIDSDSAMEGEIYYTRPESTFDQVNGIRFNIPALFPGGAGNVAGHDILPGEAHIPVYSGDTATLKVTGQSGDDVVISFEIEYDDLPGTQALFATWEEVQNLRASQFGNYVNPTGGTAGVYGTGRALTADDNRFHADKWYALLGFTVQTPCTTIALSGPPLGGWKIGAPAGVQNINTPWYFVEQAKLRGKAAIPCFGQADAANMLVYVADGEASTAPKVDFHFYELTHRPTGPQTI